MTIRIIRVSFVFRVSREKMYSVFVPNTYLSSDYAINMISSSRAWCRPVPSFILFPNSLSFQRTPAMRFPDLFTPLIA